VSAAQRASARLLLEVGGSLKQKPRTQSRFGD
jgi:hypothetical protein